MPYLGRRISPDQWELPPDFLPAEVPADLLAGRNNKKELQTLRNCLSFWESSASPEEALDRAALALASNAERLDTVTVVWIDKAALEKEGIEFSPSRGDTKVADLVPWHRDAMRLDAFRLAKVASALAAAVRGEGQLRTLTLQEVRGLLRGAIEAGRVRAENLKTGLREALQSQPR